MSDPELTETPGTPIPRDVEKGDIEGSINTPSQGVKVNYWRSLLDQALVTDEVLAWEYRGSGTDDDPYLVTWIENDPRNPLLFGKWKKAGITAFAAILTLAAAFVSSTYSGTIPQVMEDLHISNEVALLGLSLYVVGFAIGPLLWAPMGELYGRQIILFITYGVFTACNAGAAGSQNIQTLLILRFISGAFAASALTNTGGTIADIYPANIRGLAMTYFAMAPFMGPVFGPIVGGYLGESAGWRWVQGLTAIFSGVLWIASALFIPETYAPVLLRKRAAKLSQMTGKVYLSAIDAKKYGGPMEIRKELKTFLTRPWMLLIFEPIVLLLTIYMSVLYGILYMLFGAMPIIYQEGRGWSEGAGGLAFLGVLIGQIFATLYSIPENFRFKRFIKAHGSAPPEERLRPAMAAAVSVPLGLFWFAWTTQPSVPYLANMAAGIPFGFGMVILFTAIKNYLVDAYTVFAASALAATVVVRSLVGAAFPLFTDPMFHNLGNQWASSIPAFLALACTPMPFVFYKWGSSIRQKCRFAKEAEEILALTRSRSAAR